MITDTTSPVGAQPQLVSPSVSICNEQAAVLATSTIQNTQLTQLQLIQANTASALNDVVMSGTIAAVNGAVTVASQGQYTVGLSITGTFVSTYVCEGQNTDSSWTPLPMFVTQSGPPYASAMALAGPVQCVVIGGAYQNVRIRASAYTSGTIAVAMDASIAQQAVFAAQMGAWTVTSVPVDGAKATYSATATGLVQAALATDIFTISGSATKTIRVLRIRITETETTNATFNILLVNRSTANVGGTSTTVVNVAHDTTNAAATAVVRAYTANPTTLGTVVGTVDATKLYGAAAGGPGQELIWQFADLPAQAFVLRGANQSLCVNTNGVSQAGASFDIKVLFTEE